MAQPRQPIAAGEVFGRLVVLEGASKTSMMVLCRCSCGNERRVCGKRLRGGGTGSCGCLQKERVAASNQQRTLHGHGRKHARSPTFSSWQMMLQRCTNPKAPNWAYYGGRGITVCGLWHSFENFLADVGERPDGMTLDRIDNDGHYEPGNVKWSTPKQQAANRRSRR